MNDFKLPKITYSEFNFVRDGRGKPAAKFDIVNHEGDSSSIWMSKRDIERNINLHPHCVVELNKGLRWYL